MALRAQTEGPAIPADRRQRKLPLRQKWLKEGPRHSLSGCSHHTHAREQEDKRGRMNYTWTSQPGSQALVSPPPRCPTPTQGDTRRVGIFHQAPAVTTELSYDLPTQGTQKALGERSKSSSAETPDSPDRCPRRRFRDYLRNHASAELEPPPTARRRRASGHAERLRGPAGGGRQSDGRTDPQTQPCTSVAHTPTTPPTRGAAGLAQVRVRAL